MKLGTGMKLLAKNAREHLHVVSCVRKCSTGVTHPAETCVPASLQHMDETLQG